MQQLKNNNNKFRSTFRSSGYDSERQTWRKFALHICYERPAFLRAP